MTDTEVDLSPAAILAAALEQLTSRTVQLTYIAYDDKLSDKQVHQCLQGDVQGVEEELWEWTSDNEHYGLTAVIEELIPDEDERAVLEEDGDAWQELIDAIREKDESTPFDDLLRNTGSVLMRYDLGRHTGDFDIHEQPWTWTDVQHHGWAKWLCRKAGLNRRLRNREGRSNLAVASGILAEASYGGTLCVIWYADVQEMVQAALHNGPQLIAFTDPFVHVLDAYNGSGFGERMAGTIVRLFDASRCVVDTQAWGYSWTATAGPHEPSYDTDVAVRAL